MKSQGPSSGKFQNVVCCNFSPSKKTLYKILNILKFSMKNNASSFAAQMLHSNMFSQKIVYLKLLYFDNKHVIVTTVFTLSIRTPQLLTMYVLKFEPVQFTTRCCA